MEAWGVVPSRSYITTVAACPTCHSLDEARRPRKEFLPTIPDFGGTYWSFSISLKDVGSGKEAGCQFCEVVNDIFCRILTRVFHAVYSTDASVTVFVPVDTRSHWNFIIEFEYNATPAGAKVVWASTRSFCLTTIGKYPAGPLRMLPEGGYVPSNPLSEVCFRKISSWLRECTATHSATQCRKKAVQKSSFMPMRLIAVGTGAAEPRIVEYQGNVADYTALSYCWGSADILLTTTANLPERSHRLRWKHLPMVFRDAIVLTRALGIKYIWIDAICIVQDDAADMSRQLAQMAEIYHDALLVISADSASNADDRLFKERPRSFYLRTESLNQKRRASEVLVREDIDHDFLGGASTVGGDWPLARRGWTLQERFLATRIIHFSAAEVVWECSERVRCECKYMDQRGRNQKALSWASLRSRYVHSLDPSTPGDQTPECWCYIVREYSGRLCSRDYDRLPAISGLARSFGKAGIGQYRAGVWTKHVLRMVSWNRRPTGVCRRPSEYTAPSWSWASIIGPIDWEFSKDWDFGDSVPDNDDDFVAQVLDIQCGLSSENPYGRVFSGHLTISSPTLTVALRPSGGGRQLDLDMDHTLIMDVNQPEDYSEPPKLGSIVCVFLETPTQMDVPALVLKASGSGCGKFQRIGKLFVHERGKLPKLTVNVLSIY